MCFEAALKQRHAGVEPVPASRPAELTSAFSFVQKRLTNIALVKYKKFGKKFEIAYYKNTVIAWRNKV